MYIKISGLSELKEVAELAKEIWEEHYTPLIGAEQVSYMVKMYQSQEALTDAVQNDGYRYYLLYEGNILAGYAGVKPEKDALFLSKLYVRKEYRGKKLSKVLMGQVADYAKELLLPSIYLTVNKENTSAIKAYLKMGFVNEKAIVTDIGQGYVMDDYIMRIKMEDMV